MTRRAKKSELESNIEPGRTVFYDFGMALGERIARMEEHPERFVATIRVEFDDGWRKKETNLFMARSWRNYFQRRYPGIRTEIVTGNEIATATTGASKET